MQPENYSTPAIKAGTLFSPDCRNSSIEVKEAFLLRCLAVAGHSAEFVEARWPQLILELTQSPYPARPIVAANEDLERFQKLLRKYRTGQYTRLTKALEKLQELSILATGIEAVTRQQLCQIPGIGMKTASFFLLYSRGDTVAVLDRHILRYLQAEFPDECIPSEPPSSRTIYRRIERLFLAHCMSRGYDPLKYDFTIWDRARRKTDITKATCDPATSAG